MQGAGFSLSVFSANHIVKIGTSVDYGVCRGKRKDGMACTLVINKYVTCSSSIALFQNIVKKLQVLFLCASLFVQVFIHLID